MERKDHDNNNGPSFASQSHRPAKRQRTSGALSATVNAPNASSSHVDALETSSATSRRSRGATACETCRGRKTKCNQQRPACGYCVKNDIVCVYLGEDVAAGCNIYGPQILDAVHALGDLILSQHEPPQDAHRATLFSQRRPSDPHLREQPSDKLPSFAEFQKFTPNLQSNHHASSAETTAAGVQPYIARQNDRSSLGVGSVMQWSNLADLALPDLFPDDDDPDPALATHLPSMVLEDLNKLIAKYVKGVHIFNPILDLPYVRRCAEEIAEFGLTWTVDTCLVMLVCAIGAMSEGPGPSNEILEDNFKQAWEYWSVASKRFGLIISQDNIEAIQCLSLVGIWYMHSMQPLQAWKYFSLAGNAWYASTRRRALLGDSSATQQDEGQVSLQQSLYFTIYKSECELRIDLNIPGSILADIDLPFTFPLPPSLDMQRPPKDVEITQRGWYYYLADIAARHQVNNLMRLRSGLTVSPERQNMLKLYQNVDVLEAQLAEWHKALPSTISFQAPNDTMVPPSDELSSILHFRYLVISELTYRPFVQLCVEHELDMEASRLSSIVLMAEHCLRLCVFKLQELSNLTPRRHHGTWFGLNTILLSSLILSAVYRARRDPKRLGAASIVMPNGWKEEITRTVRQWHRFLQAKNGGAQKIKQSIDWILRDVDIPTVTR